MTGTNSVSKVVIKRIMDAPISGSNRLLATAMVFWVASQIILIKQCQFLKDNYGGGTDIPDAWFGSTADNFYDYLHKLGPQGRRIYTYINILDLLFYIPSYSILLRALILRQCRLAGISKTMSWISFAVEIFDIIESLLFGYATRQFPNRLETVYLMTAFTANKGKWTSLLIVMLMLATLSSRNIYVACIRSKIHKK